MNLISGERRDAGPVGTKARNRTPAEAEVGPETGR